jgi:hypothetical protein
MNTTLVIVIGIVLLALVGAAMVLRQRRSKAMRARYGAEYIAAVDETGDRHKAEAELRAREKRVHSFDIRPLERGEVERFSDRWRSVQAQFVDDPGAAISRADDLLGEVMGARGYPVTDFEQRAADLSVEHPKLVSNYRIAHDVAERHARGDADTEDMRRAMIRFRELFEDLLGLPTETSRPGEDRAFTSKEPDHERTARDRADEPGRRPDDRATRQRREARRDSGRDPHVR